MTDLFPPEEAAGVALRVAFAGAHAAWKRIQHRIAWNMAERDAGRAERARSELADLGLWTGEPDLPGAVARLTAGRLKPDGLAERMLSMGLVAAEVYILACEADALGLILVHEARPLLANRLMQLEPRLLSARESLAGAIDRFVQGFDASAFPAVHDAAIVLAEASSTDVPVWNAPEAKHLRRPGESWTARVIEGLRRINVALGFPAERTPSPASDAEVTCLQAMLARPDDDAVRHEWVSLAAARGDARAELGRAQLKTREERRRSYLNPGHLIGDSELVRSLIARHPEWQSDVKRHGATAAWFHRGFVEDIEIDAEVFLAKGSDLFGIAPILHVRLRGGAARFLEPLLARGLLDRMLAIDLTGQQLDDTHAGMLASRGLRNLRALTLDGNRISEVGARAVYASETLRQLVFLSLGGNPCGPLAESGFTYAEYPTPIVELTELGARLSRELGSRAYLYSLSAPSFDLLTCPLSGAT